MTLLRVENLSITHRHGRNLTPLTRDVSFALDPGECLGIVGGSGSGKSLTCGAITGLLSEHLLVSGQVDFKGVDLLTLPAKERRELRGSRICMILQSPMTAFNPLSTIGAQIVETITAHQRVAPAAALEMMVKGFARVNLRAPRSIFGKYPHELSGGMLQRVMTALALVMRPEIIIADEPTTAIDYVSQQDVIRELKTIRSEHQTALIFVSHDLSLVSHVADNVLVMREGVVVEEGDTGAVFFNPRHDYTRGLIENRQSVIQTFVQVMGQAYAA
jgi:nickel transport system ATP-binding protein